MPVHGADSREPALLSASTLALVLAGGNGTRLGALTRAECKPAVPFAGRYRNIDFSLSNCIHSGIRRVAVLTQYNAQTLIRHLEWAWSFLPRNLGEFVDPWPAQQRGHTRWYSGTADALHQNIGMIRSSSPRLVLVLAGDHVYRMDYRPLLQQHLASAADVTIACVEVPRSQAPSFGVMTLDQSRRVSRFVEKPALSELPAAARRVRASMGVYVFSTDYLCERLASDALSDNSSHDLGRDVIPAAVSEDRVFGHDFVDPATGQPGFWRDVGTLDSYWAAHMEILQPEVAARLFDAVWPIFTEPGRLPPPMISAGSLATISGALISEGCSIASARIRESVLGPAVRVEADALVEECVLLPGSHIGRGCRLRRAIVERGCRLPDGFAIGYDPEADTQRFRTTPGDVVLVTREAFLQQCTRSALRASSGEAAIQPLQHALVRL